MLFSKKAIDLKKLKEEDPDAYDTLVAEATVFVEHEESKELNKLKEENIKLRAEKASNDLKNLIMDYGIKLDVVDVAEKAIKEGSDFNNALKNMVDTHIINEENIKNSFDNTASDGAGVSPEGENEDEPKDFAEAIEIISKRDNITKKEAAVKAKKEFSNLFKKIYE